jgi:hypothetical protein
MKKPGKKTEGGLARQRETENSGRETSRKSETATE